MVSMKKIEDTFLIKYHYIQQNYYGKNQDGIVKNKSVDWNIKLKIYSTYMKNYHMIKVTVPFSGK